jgi:hypothetical protein
MVSQYRIERERGTKECQRQFTVLPENWPPAFPAKDQDVRPLSIRATGEVAAAMGPVGAFVVEAAPATGFLVSDRRPRSTAMTPNSPPR